MNYYITSLKGTPIILACFAYFSFAITRLFISVFLKFIMGYPLLIIWFQFWSLPGFLGTRISKQKIAGKCFHSCSLKNDYMMAFSLYEMLWNQISHIWWKYSIRQKYDSNTRTGSYFVQWKLVVLPQMYAKPCTSHWPHCMLRILKEGRRLRPYICDMMRYPPTWLVIDLSQSDSFPNKLQTRPGLSII